MALAIFCPARKRRALSQGAKPWISLIHEGPRAGVADTRISPCRGMRMSTEESYGIAAGELRQFVERIEHLEQEKKDIAEQIKEVYSESKGRGYDTKALRAIISLRKKDKDQVAEEEAVLEIYKEALGMR